MRRIGCCGCLRTHSCCVCHPRQEVTRKRSPASLFIVALLAQALPTCIGNEAECADQQSCIWRDGDELCMRLLCRKNMQIGSGVIRRACCCSHRPSMCPVHALWEGYLEPMGIGRKPWSHISPQAAIARLRAVLHELKVEEASRYRTHDLRRGHAQAGYNTFCAL